MRREYGKGEDWGRLRKRTIKRIERKGEDFDKENEYKVDEIDEDEQSGFEEET